MSRRGRHGEAAVRDGKMARISHLQLIVSVKVGKR